MVIGLTLACGGRPTEVLKSAETALTGAMLAKKCAPEEYAAAEQMYAKAQKLADDEKYEEAEEAALAAEKLAKAAAEKAEARRDECEKPKTETVSTNNFVEDGPIEEPVEETVGELETVYFGFNVSALDDAAKTKMTHNAGLLRKPTDTKVTVIEGHCDSRGSTEYNLALGEKRALAAKQYLVDLGVDDKTLTVMSYGEERLDALEETEAAHGRNRRVEFKSQ